MLTALILSATLSFAQNTFPTSGNAGVNTTTPAYNLDVNGTFNTNSLYVGKQLLIPGGATTTERGYYNLILAGIRSGKKVHPDEQFDNGTNSIAVYNNAGNSVLSVARVSAAGLPNTSGYCVEVTYTGAGLPGLGGWIQPVVSAANRTFVQLFRAKVPVGYTLSNTSNAIGNGSSRVWLTNNVGTGKWEDYAVMLVCGTDGTFAAAGHIYLNGPTPTAAAPVVVRIASSCVYDMSSYTEEKILNQQTADQNASLRIGGNGYLGGNVGIGTTDTKGYKLAVNGPAVFLKAVVKPYNNWPDYVFSKDYNLPSLASLQAYIEKERHLPYIPPAKEVETNGLDLAETQKGLVRSLEEQALYILQLKKEIDELKRELQVLSTTR